MELPKDYDFKTVEQKWQQHWEKEKVYRFDRTVKKNVYSIDTPPPTVSGNMHLGHAFSYAQGDFIARFQRMLGNNVFYPFGTDDNGLPTERLVEKLKKVSSNRMPRHEFIKLCHATIEEIKEDFIKDWKAIGMSADFSKAYSTIDPHCIKTSQLSFIDLYKKGRIYQQDYPTMWCTLCRTAIAQAEVDDPEFDSHFNDIVFHVGEREVVIATTRPELIPACVALMFHPNDERYKKLKGKFAKVPLFGYEVPILVDEKVDPTKGTGIVMCCTFGDQTDVEWWNKHKLQLRSVLTNNGRLNDLAMQFKDMPLREARKAILEELRSKNLLLLQKPIKHFVKVHERCSTEIEFLKTRQWFIKVLDKKKELLDAGNHLVWYPSYMKTRYVHWVENLQWDWCISRQRHFGVPFPLWSCKKCSMVLLASKEQLPIDPLQEKPSKACQCGSKEFQGELDVMDTWATSSLTPQIALDWINDEKFFEQHSPMSIRLQAHDIIRTWAFYTITKAVYHSQKVPWKHIAISGHALDPHGKKMSKSKGNVIDPRKVLQQYGADALRFWAANAKLGEDVPFQEKELVAGKRMATKLWNASKFCLLQLQGYAGDKPRTYAPMDKWILSKLQHLVEECTGTFTQYEYSRTKAATEHFFWHVFCDHYLELVKDRLYAKEKYAKDEVVSAQYTLHAVLKTVLKLIAPIMPHITEEIYSIAFAKEEKKESIHFAAWPVADKHLLDKKAEELGESAVQAIALGRKWKSDKGMSLGAEVSTVTIESPVDLTPVLRDIKGVLRAKDVEWKKGEEVCVKIK